MDERTSDASVVTNRRADFRTRVTQRDVACVVTGEPQWNCDACHILPHSKGDNYISNVILRRRGIDYPKNIDVIDDPRNGLLLNTIFHRRFGDGDLAFLKTPNFALTVNDIPFILPTQADAAAPTSRLTLHHFANAAVLGPSLSMLAPHNSDAREPQDTDEWPPTLILDYVYAAAVLQAWGQQDFVDYAGPHTRAAYYDNIEGGDEDDNNHTTKPQPGHSDVPVASTSAQPPRHGYSLRSRGPVQATGQRKARPLEEVMDALLGFWMRSAERGGSKPKTGALDSARNEDIATWLQSVEEARDHGKP